MTSLTSVSTLFHHQVAEGSTHKGITCSGYIKYAMETILNQWTNRKCDLFARDKLHYTHKNILWASSVITMQDMYQ